MFYDFKTISIMEIKITTKQILKVLIFIAWFIFIALCVEAGEIIYNSIFTLFIYPENANYYWGGADLLPLYNYDESHFLVIACYMSIIAVLKAIMFYLIIKVAYYKKIDIKQPFSLRLVHFVSNVAYLAIGIAIFSYMGAKYSYGLISESIVIPDIERLNFGGADVWFFMGFALLIIAQIFKRGVEIQEEHELTV